MILPPTPEHLRLAAETIARGELIGMPTETVYGLAGDAFNVTAVGRIFAAKERPTFDPLIVHVTSPSTPDPVRELDERGVVAAAELGANARARAEALMRAFWPGPLTLVLPKHARVPDLVTSGLPSVAVRAPRHPVAQALLAAAGTPLAAPSANRFGRISPTSAADVEAELGDRVPLILDGGRCEVGVESTVLAIGPDGALTLLRPGGTPIEQIERIAGARAQVIARSAPGVSAASPGLLDSHYAPRTPLILLAGLVSEAPPLPEALPSTIGLLAQSGDAEKISEALRRRTQRSVIVRVLSPTGDREEAARNLFAALRALDDSNAKLLLAEPCTDESGLGHAIGDRLRRASSRS